MDYDADQGQPLLGGPKPAATRGAEQRALVPVPPPPKRSTLLRVCPFILGNEFCERLAYYGLATNFVTYLTHIMGVDAATAAIEVMVFEGTCYVTPLLGAYLADSHWGRYTTILVFSCIYLLGMVLLTLTSWLPGLTPAPDDAPSGLQNALLFGSLAVIALGTGGIKPNVSAFGADQFDEKEPQDKREKESFFNWFYLAINLGSLIACTAIVWVQDSISWSLGFALPAIAMAAAVCLFLAGSGRYRHVAPTESPLVRVVRVVRAALVNRWRHRRGALAGQGSLQQQAQQAQLQQQQQQQQVFDLPGGEAADGSLHRALLYQRYGLAPQQAAGQAQAGAVNGGGSNSSARGGAGRRGSSSSSYRWLEEAITEWQTSQGQLVSSGPGPGAGGPGGCAGGYTAQQVEEVKLVLRLLPVFATTVMYWTVYSMMGTFFIQQGTLMDNQVSLGGLSLRIPAATMALFNTGAIILLVPLYDRAFEPALRACGAKWTLLRRIGWGMLVAVVAMAYSAAVERWRLDIYASMAAGDLHASASGLARGGGGGGGSGGSGGYAPSVVPLSILWQAPAYVLVGASEVLASIAQLEFFYDQAPDVMRSCSMALQLLSTALGSYLGGGLVAAVAAASSAAGSPWLPRDLNAGRLDAFLLLCGALMAANTAAFVGVANRYEYKAVEHVVLVQVPDEEVPAVATPGLPPRPPAPPRRAPGAGVPIAGGAPRRGQYHYAAEEGGEGGGLYSRSLAFVPTSPALPAPFR